MGIHICISSKPFAFFGPYGRAYLLSKSIASLFKFGFLKLLNIYLNIFFASSFLSISYSCLFLFLSIHRVFGLLGISHLFLKLRYNGTLLVFLEIDDLSTISLNLFCRIDRKSIGRTAPRYWMVDLNLSDSGELKCFILKKRDHWKLAIISVVFLYSFVTLALTFRFLSVILFQKAFSIL